MQQALAVGQAFSSRSTGTPWDYLESSLQAPTSRIRWHISGGVRTCRRGGTAVHFVRPRRAFRSLVSCCTLRLNGVVTEAALDPDVQVALSVAHRSTHFDKTWSTATTSPGFERRAFQAENFGGLIGREVLGRCLHFSIQRRFAWMGFLQGRRQTVSAKITALVCRDDAGVSEVFSNAFGCGVLC